MEKDSVTGTVYTLAAKCRDCYRCLKVCPVKAIRMKDGQAYVDPQRCIACGTCIRECPQRAKVYTQSLHEAKKIIDSGVPAAASLAPSFAAFYPGWKTRRIASALRRLGFCRVAETSEAAAESAQESTRLFNARPGAASVCTACPAVVNYVEKYKPQMAGALLPAASPMITHARRLKAEGPPETRVIFIGPCVAKKQEAGRPEYEGIVDCVLTFEELDSWFEEERVRLEECEESAPDGKAAGYSGYFPLPGGLFMTAGIETVTGGTRHMHVSGAAEVIAAIDYCVRAPAVLEPLFCVHGCINGPGAGESVNVFERRQGLADYAAGAAAVPQNKQQGRMAAREEYCASPVITAAHAEEEINAVLLQTGKSPETGLMNCGACGYDSCREKAAAVLDGMAEVEMCLPYMRMLAEQRTDIIIETSPNGIVLLDEHLKVIKMNPAFKKYFAADDTRLGGDISVIMDPACFEKLAAGTGDSIEAAAGSAAGGYSLHGLYYALRQYRQYVGIFVDVTLLRQDREKLEDIKQKTACQAKAMLDEQVKMSQQIAWQLGENMARTEALVKKLAVLAGEEGGDAGKNR